MLARDKVKSLQELVSIRQLARRQGEGVVFTNGCFDLLHVGHVRYLESARSLGDILVVGVNSDASVAEIKGPLRPILPATERSELVAALHCVDYVCLFGTPDPLPLIKALQPDILVKGADWSVDRIIGADEVARSGGQVVTIPLTAGASTTNLIEIILKRFRVA
jgi:D-glycero-beta-D-manno-heptose 1-phosphate adenylyltransferase